ncbi:MAG: tetratricopeptide repeat protein [Colwellia sp.]|nr:tetratricopeptide repeat protein [Colwellia sp.]
MQKIICAVFLSLLIYGCQNSVSSIQPLVSQPPLLDDSFINHQTIIVESEENIFALDNEMKVMVAKKLKPDKNIKRRTLKLLKQIFDSEEISLTYKSNANVNARQAYHKQQANCLSLTIMAYALAKEADLNVKFQQVDTPEYWVRNGEYNLLTGHVNLLVKQKNHDNNSYIWGRNGFQIDFDPLASKSSFKRTVIQKNTVLAMFYNNKGAEALVDGDYNTAYAYFKQATVIAPLFSQTWGNLGILYKYRDKYDEAEQSYRYAIYLDSTNFTAMENLAILFTQQEKFEEALSIRHKLHKKRSSNPYYYALLADEAFYDGNFEQAISYYKKAIRMERKAHEFHFGLAKVYYQLNQPKLAEKSLKRAIAYNRNGDSQGLYTAKLNLIRDNNIEN